MKLEIKGAVFALLYFLTAAFSHSKSGRRIHLGKEFIFCLGKHFNGLFGYAKVGGQVKVAKLCLIKSIFKDFCFLWWS